MSPRVLVVDPGVGYSTQDVHRGIVKGLTACGAQVNTFGLTERLTAIGHAFIREDSGKERPLFPSWDDILNVANEMLRGAIWSAAPDLVVVVQGSFVDVVTLKVCRARGVPVCAVMTEQPYELPREMALAGLVDHVALNDPTHIDRFREVCGNVWYRPHAYDPTLHHAAGRTDDLGAVWIGTAYPSRVDWLEASMPSWPDGIDVHLGGNWIAMLAESPLAPHLIHPEDLEWCIDNDEVAAWYRRARLSWNTYRTESMDDGLSDGWSVGPREVELAATGTFFARESRPEGDELFPMLPIIDDPAELGEVMKWSEAHPDERRDAARKAADAVADRTFDRSAADLLSRCGFDV